MFTGAVLVDIATPYFTVKQQSALLRLSTSKFPERFSLFTMIVLGESVVGVIVGLSELEDQRVLDGAGIAAGVLGLGIGFSLWWIYFDFVARRAPKPVFVTALFWVYLHLATLTAITATGVGVSIAIADTETGTLSNPGRFLLVGSVVLGLVGVAALETTLAREADEPTHSRLSPALKVGVAVVIGILGTLDLGWSTHVLLVLLLAGLAVPMAYGAVVWFSHPGRDESAESTAPATRSPGTSGSTRVR